MKLLRDPLVHFLAGGALLFALYARVNGGEPDEGRIVVSEARVASLASGFERTWMRPPSPDELRALVDDYVREEILYREALALGLDRDDLVVRRRMRQKMEFLNAEIADLAEPTREELESYLEAHPERFREPERWSFQQVFVSPDRSGDVEERARALLARLRAAPDAGVDGDPTLLPPGLEGASAEEIARTFGTGFAAELARAPEGRWGPPIASAYGLHLVRVTGREPGRLPDLDEVRSTVEREWTAERRRESEERFYRDLRQRYEVEVRMPSDGARDLARQP